MTEEQKNFDLVFKDLGGIFDIEQVPHGNLRLTLQELKNETQSFITGLRLAYPKLPHINFDLLNNPTLNACADMVGNNYYIGLNIGSYLLVYDMFSKMLANKTALPEIGDISLEIDSNKKLNRFIYNDEINFNPYKFEPVLPVDQTRGVFTVVLTSLALNYLIHHEIGHIIRGHCGYYKKLREKEHWSELELKQLANPLHFQTMEMDADSFAVNYAFLSTENAAKAHASGNPTSYPWNLIYADTMTFFRYWMFAIYSFHRLCNFENFSEEETNELSHPPPSVRVSIMAANIVTIMDNRNMPNSQEMAKMLMAIPVEAETAFSKITYDENRPDIFLSSVVLSDNYSRKVCYNWNNVLPLVKPFAINPERLPPPVAI